MKAIYIVGIGPGKIEMMTFQAVSAIKNSDVVVGYTTYIDLIKENFPEKEFKSTPMRKEIERCRLCFDLALEDKKVALICSGDAGVYGMASPMFFLQKENPEYAEVGLCVVPGITAANSGAAVLGAPLNHDYCVISLSDLLTPWQTIEKRLMAAVLGDFAVAIYNPQSHKRDDYLKKACEIMIKAGAKKERACGLVENIGRSGTRAEVCTLGELMEKKVNMFTTVFIGNSQSEILEIRKNRIFDKKTEGDFDNISENNSRKISERDFDNASENVLKADSRENFENDSESEEKLERNLKCDFEKKSENVSENLLKSDSESETFEEKSGGGSKQKSKIGSGFCFGQDSESRKYLVTKRGYKI